MITEASAAAVAMTPAASNLIHTTDIVGLIKDNIVPILLGFITIFMLMQARKGQLSKNAGILANVALALTPLLAYAAFEALATGAAKFVG